VPLVSSTIDVIVARNSLDHVDDPRAAIAEARRLLRPGGTLILNFDVEHTRRPPSRTLSMRTRHGRGSAP
jgi:ubiquinone/menaquinone biosynthesis C-methylase UbiE